MQDRRAGRPRAKFFMAHATTACSPNPAGGGGGDLALAQQPHAVALQPHALALQPHAVATSNTPPPYNQRIQQLQGPQG